MDERFLHSTRGKILSLLRKREMTVQDLSEEIGLTDNAVRIHLAMLERDGLVRSVSTRPSSRKPARLYGLDPDAEHRLSTAYPPFLAQLLDTLGGSLSAEERERTMREVGTRLAGDRRIPAGPDLLRARHAAEALEQLGGSCEVVTKDETLAIQGTGCPLSLVTRNHAEACLAVEAMLSTLLDGEVHEHCTRGERPRCFFQTSLKAS